MKTLFGKALVILTVSVAIGANGAPPVSNGPPATTETTARAFVPPDVVGAVNPEPVVDQKLHGTSGRLLTANGFVGPLTPGSAPIDGVPVRNLDFIPAGTRHDPAPIAPSDVALSDSRMGELPPSGWQNLPFNTVPPAATKPLQSKPTPTGVRRNVEDREMSSIRRLIQDGGLRPAESVRQFDGQMNPAWSMQPDVSFSGDQINILKTFLR